MTESKGPPSRFKEFVELCEKEGLLTRPAELTPEDTIDGINDETTLKRFFIGRNSDPHGALQQFKESLSARKQVQDITTYSTIDVNIYEETRKIYPHWIGRRDTRGLPIYAYDVAALDPPTLAAYDQSGSLPQTNSATEPNQAQRAFAFYDTVVRFTLPLCSAMRDRAEPEVPVTGSVIIVDVASFGLKQAWGARSYASNISRILATSFPEVLDRVYVINAPFYFPKIWAIVKNFIDPRTTEKLVILSVSETLPRLQETIAIENIPVQFGGEFEYEPGGLPNLDEGLRKQLRWVGESRTKLPAGPLKWIVRDGQRTAVVTGSVGGEKVCVPFAVLEEGSEGVEMKVG